VIASAVTYIAGQLNQYLKRTSDSSEDVVVVSNILEQDGTLATNVNNRLVVFLVNVEKDATAQRQPNSDRHGADGRLVTYPPIYLNLYVMVAAHYGSGNYGEALKFLSAAISFFQGRPLFDRANSPDLDGRIERLVLDIENLSVHDLSNLWGVLSGHYLPSVLYKVRMVAFDSRDVRKWTPSIKQPEIAGRPG
jgi:Pvc16 N-terminal domain